MNEQQGFISYATLQSLVDGIIVIDIEQVIQLISQAACRLLDVDADSILGSRFAEIPVIAGLKTSGQTIELSEDTKLPHGPYEHKWGIGFPNGRFLRFQTRPVIDNERQQRIGTLIRIEEVTLEHTARDVLQAMFNEMHMPIKLIKGYADCLLGGVDEPLTEKQREMVAVISTMAERLLTLKQDVREAFKKQVQDETSAMQ